MIGLKRAYDSAERGDGRRFLVDQMWPRGLKKDEVKVESWLRPVSPSTGLRNWYKHDPAKWKEFERRYFAELNKKPETWEPLLQAARTGHITLVYSARDTEHNNAVALKEYLEKKLKS